MDTFFADLRYGLKQLIKHKAFTLTAVLTLGLAIGANTAIFSVLDSVLFEPLPFEEPHRLVSVFNSYPNAGVERASNGVPDYFDRREQVPAFEESALYRFTRLTVGTDGAPQQLRSLVVTPTFFDVLRVEPALGRGFTTEEGEPGAAKVVILSHIVHQELFAGASDVVGQDLQIDGESHQIIGVMAADFRFGNPDLRLFLPVAFSAEDRSDDRRHSNNWNQIARLAPGASLEQAKTQIDALNAANLERFPQFTQLLIDAGFHTQAYIYLEDMVRDVRPTLYLLWGGVAFVLLIACVNLANLILVRSNTRLKELSTRFALGAGRRQVAAQLMIESLMLALVGGLAGLGFGRLGLEGLSLLGLDDLPRGTEIGMDGSAVAVTLAASVVIGLVLGAIPLARIFGLNLNAVLREETRGGTGGKGTRLVGRLLVTGQVALAFVLLIGAGLMLTSFRTILAADPGFDTDTVLTASVSLPTSRYEDDDAVRAFTRRATERIRSLPGVTQAGAGDTVPLGGSFSDSVIFPEGYVARPGESVVSPSRINIGPGYLEAMGVELLAGRRFDGRDESESQQVVLVDRTLAKHFWGEQDPIGKRMFFPNNTEDLTDPGDDPEWLTVVGVVEAIKLKDLEDGGSPFGAYYMPLEQNTRRGIAFAVASSNPTAVLPELRRLFQELDPEMPIFDARTMEERVELSMVDRRTPMILAMVFGAVALLLAAVGIYGVLAVLVSRRGREMGIRMALGSSMRGIFALVLQEGFLVVGVGLALGLAGSALLGKVLTSHLYGIEAVDPGVISVVALLLGVVAMAACAVPGWRAASIDPASALHE